MKRQLFCVVSICAGEGAHPWSAVCLSYYWTISFAWLTSLATHAWIALAATFSPYFLLLPDPIIPLCPIDDHFAADDRRGLPTRGSRLGAPRAGISHRRSKRVRTLSRKTMPMPAPAPARMTALSVPPNRRRAAVAPAWDDRWCSRDNSVAVVAARGAPL